jgi:hypothetical protein
MSVLFQNTGLDYRRSRITIRRISLRKKAFALLLLLSAGMLMSPAITQAASVTAPPSGSASLLNDEVFANEGNNYERDLNGCGPALGFDCSRGA